MRSLRELTVNGKNPAFNKRPNGLQRAGQSAFVTPGHPLGSEEHHRTLPELQGVGGSGDVAAPAKAPHAASDWIDAKTVEQIVHLSRRSIDRLENRGQFPRRIRLGHRTIRWVRGEIEQWMRDQEDRREADESGRTK
ncbi:AlpA family phage regulatory protein [Ectothiorhodospiraceae bacterium WFHF3C12]|nr:AlpA family phage regulatory protein [Ectothiorhodospiraceae bacterium WFHF3C12]